MYESECFRLRECVRVSEFESECERVCVCVCENAEPQISKETMPGIKIIWAAKAVYRELPTWPIGSCLRGASGIIYKTPDKNLASPIPHILPNSIFPLLKKTKMHIFFRFITTRVDFPKFQPNLSNKSELYRNWVRGAS